MPNFTGQTLTYVNDAFVIMAGDLSLGIFTLRLECIGDVDGFSPPKHFLVENNEIGRPAIFSWLEGPPLGPSIGEAFARAVTKQIKADWPYIEEWAVQQAFAGGLDEPAYPAAAE